MTPQPLPPDYAERVYAGWLGKCIGVRFGAPLENWTYEEIRNNLGELTGYLREDQGKIFKPDDDTSVPMILIRALEDYGATSEIIAAQIGDTILNYVADGHGSFWWGGYGISTEHTAYANLADGIPAPRSGSIQQNGATMAEQIGGQIFSDIWGLVAPNNPALAADLAEKAASVTHDGNGIYGGRFIAAMVSAAFSEANPERLIEIGLAQIPPESEYTRVIRAMVEFYHQHPEDWHAGFAYLKANFGYDRYPGTVHIIPNAGVIALGILYGKGDFSRTLQITNMAGWDTDCNVGNVGAIMGVALGLNALDASWRDPMNDLLITAGLVGTRSILTIPQCIDLFVRLGRALNGVEASPAPVRYHFQYRGSTSSFQARGVNGRPIHWMQTVENGQASLKVAVRKLNKKGEMRIFTRTYYRPRELSGNYYGAAFTPLIYPGQTITAKVFIPASAPDTILAAPYVLDLYSGVAPQAKGQPLVPGKWQTLHYDIPSMTDACISEVGIILKNTGEVWETGAFHLAELDWSGIPKFDTTFAHNKPETGAISEWSYLRGYWRIEKTDGAYHGSGIGENETYSGDITWRDYAVSAELTPILGEHHLVNIRVQGALRSYAFGLAPNNTIALYKKDKTYTHIQSAMFNWQHSEKCRLTMQAKGDMLFATIEGSGQSRTMEWQDSEAPYLNGQIGLSNWQGSHTAYHSVSVTPAE